MTINGAKFASINVYRPLISQYLGLKAESAATEIYKDFSVKITKVTGGTMTFTSATDFAAYLDSLKLSEYAANFGSGASIVVSPDATRYIRNQLVESDFIRYDERLDEIRDRLEMVNLDRSVDESASFELQENVVDYEHIMDDMYAMMAEASNNSSLLLLAAACVKFEKLEKALEDKEKQEEDVEDATNPNGDPDGDKVPNKDDGDNDNPNESIWDQTERGIPMLRDADWAQSALELIDPIRADAYLKLDEIQMKYVKMLMAR